jgi:F0F1-type ATP synthase assembly protein I
MLGSRRELSQYIAYAQVGFEMVVPIGLGLLLDHYLGTLPWITVGGAAFGLVAGVAHLVAMLNAAEKRKAGNGK